MLLGHFNCWKNEACLEKVYGKVKSCIRDELVPCFKHSRGPIDVMDNYTSDFLAVGQD